MLGAGGKREQRETDMIGRKEDSGMHRKACFCQSTQNVHQETVG